MKNTFCLLTLCTLTACVVSCASKDEDAAPVKDGATLTLTVNGTAIPENARATLPQKAMGTTLQTKGQPKLVRLGGVDALVEALEYTPEYAPAQTGSKIAGTSAAVPAGGEITAAASPMRDGVRYRLLVYNTADELVVNEVASAGTAQQIRVDAGTDYDWYAVSVNETAGVPDIDGGGVVAKEDLANKDILWARGSISTVAGENPLGITFQRLTARVRIKVNVRGLFGTIAGTTGISLVNRDPGNPDISFLPPITVSNLHVKVGGFSDRSRIDPVVLASDMADEPGNPDGTVKIADFYTMEPVYLHAAQLRARFNALHITLDDGRTREYAANTEFEQPIVRPGNFGEVGGLNIRFVESAVAVGGIQWARTNLLYDDAHTDKYRFRSNPAGSGAGSDGIGLPTEDVDTDYWNWKSETPAGPPADFDPCTAVYPEGTWRMPTLTEWESIGQPDSEDVTNWPLWGWDYGLTWQRDAGTPANAVYDVDHLYIPFGGFRPDGEMVIRESPAGIPESEIYYGYEPHYWSSTEYDADRGAGMSSFLGADNPDDPTAGLFWGSWLADTYSATSIKTAGKNIRCVRASL